MLDLVEAASDVSRTNQLKITSSDEDVAERLFQYLFKRRLGIETFAVDNLDLSNYDGSSLSFYQKRDRAIRHEIQRRLTEKDVTLSYSEIKYSISHSDKGTYVFFVSPNSGHSGWKHLFCQTGRGHNRERILNLIFRLHLLLDGFEALDTSANGLEDGQRLLFVDSHHSTKSGNGIVIWGQSLYVHFNYHNVLSLDLSRKRLLLIPEGDYEFLDGDDLGELLVYRENRYYCAKRLDARKKNRILFMRFGTDNEDYDNFKKTQLYYYQRLMTQLEDFLDTCGIEYTPLWFQADHYLENSFIESIAPVDSLEIINNIGVDLTENDRRFLRNLIRVYWFSVNWNFTSGE